MAGFNNIDPLYLSGAAAEQKRHCISVRAVQSADQRSFPQLEPLPSSISSTSPIPMLSTIRSG